ncbi:glutathione S-transferase T3-like [Asparagus officinalis]|uniref:glutathione S-transferase T3-like n=1 Tax=Asparagus officinalis TaxID=4686 RepID=UPI00098DE366|nr:glutathione S-transferase T3-like [Asparagus officinalis]XP_020268315.1 glutathione S-transferase T3-like [Asparagus officinalis]
MASSRGKSFLQEEDQILCATWLEISQDPVLGSNQKKDKLWERISALFHERISNVYTGHRSPKSLSCRMQLIMKAISKFRGCIRQVERLNPSGASELDINKRARIIFAEDPEEKRGFLFDHVWPILKDAEKWANISVMPSASSKISKSRLSQGSDSNSPVIDLNEDNQAYSPNDDDHSPMSISTSRPIGRKKEKLRRRKEIERNIDFEDFAKGNQEILEVLKKGKEQRENERLTMNQAMMLKAENDKKKLELQQERQEKEIMLVDLEAITDPTKREYFRNKQQQILNRNITRGSSSDIPNPEYSYAGSQYGIPDYRGGGYGGVDFPDF